MKRAKFALTAVTVLTVIGGALAFKANLISRNFYSLGGYTIFGVQTSACVVTVHLNLLPTSSTVPIAVRTPYISTINTTLPTTTCETYVVTSI